MKCDDLPMIVAFLVIQFTTCERVGSVWIGDLVQKAKLTMFAN